MKIVLGVNLFGDKHRHNLAKESYKRLAEKFGVKLLNLQFEDSVSPIVTDDDFELVTMQLSSKDYCDSTKALPMTRDVFDILAEHDADMFVFTNDDIIISPKFIEHVLGSNYDTYSASRMSINQLESLESDIVLNDHYQVAGFDVFAIRPEWWLINREKFPNYILGYPYWDVHYALLCMRHSNGCLVNKWPPTSFHIRHPIVWNDDSVEKSYNEDIFWSNHKPDALIWQSYVYNVLLKRSNNYYDVFSNEEELEQIYFKS